MYFIQLFRALTIRRRTLGRADTTKHAAAVRPVCGAAIGIFYRLESETEKTNTYICFIGTWHFA